MQPASMSFLGAEPTIANTMDWVTTQLVARGWATQDDASNPDGLPATFEL